MEASGWYPWQYLVVQDLVERKNTAGGGGHLSVVHGLEVSADNLEVLLG